MRILIKFISIIGLVSMSQTAVAIDNVEDGDVLTADTMNEIIDATNANSRGFDFDIDNPCGIGGTVYSVGDRGPQNGWVFITDAGGCNGLEAWTTDEDGGATKTWGCMNTDVPGADGTGIGTGAPNSLDVVDAGCAGADEAVPLTRVGGDMIETDWYLPSRNELLEMYKTIGPGGTNVGLFAPEGVYWSSTEVDSTSAYQVNFKNGVVGTPDKDFVRKVRAIRTFNQP